MTMEKTHLPSRGYEDLSRDCRDQSRECGMKGLLWLTNPNLYLEINTSGYNGN